jgi:WD40 repeat protein
LFSAAQVSGSYDTTVRFWNLDSLRCVRKCEGHEDAVRVLAVVNGKVIFGPRTTHLEGLDLLTR